MRLTVIGGTGLIGSRVVKKLTAAGHEAVPAALSTGLDLITGKGLDQALEGAEVVVNVANSPTCQFFEFMNTVVFETADDSTVRLPATRVQPIAAADVAGAVVEVCTGSPLRGIRNFTGPDVFPLDELGRVTLAAQRDTRTVVTDDKAGVFAGVTGDVLIAGPDAHLAATHYRDWIQKAR